MCCMSYLEQFFFFTKTDKFCSPNFTNSKILETHQINYANKLPKLQIFATSNPNSFAPNFKLVLGEFFIIISPQLKRSTLTNIAHITNFRILKL